MRGAGHPEVGALAKPFDGNEWMWFRGFMEAVGLTHNPASARCGRAFNRRIGGRYTNQYNRSVSYTHLTLPTIYSV